MIGLICIKKAQPKNDKKKDWISFSKNFSFQRQIFLGWAFRKTKKTWKRPVTHSQTHCKQVGKRNWNQKKLPAFLDFYSLIFTPFFLVFSNSYFFTLNRILISICSWSKHHNLRACRICILYYFVIR